MKKQRYRAVVFCTSEWGKDLRETDSKWVDTIAEALDWAHKEQYEWTCPTGKRFILESEMKQPRYTICPHCGGPMGKAEDYDHDYCCQKCDRGWRINRKGKVWCALFSAGMEVYARHEVRDAQMHKQLLEWRTMN